MATYVPITALPWQFQDPVTSLNMSGGSIEFYLAGTSTPTNLFSDNAGTSIGSSITLNSAGMPESGGNVIVLWRDDSIALKLVLKNAAGSVIDTSDHLPAPASARSIASYGVTSSETTALVTPTDLTIPPYVRGRYANFADWKSACDQAGAEGTLDATYAITADTPLPLKASFRGFEITGAFYTDHTGQDGWVKDWKAKQPRWTSSTRNEYTNIFTGLNDTGFVTVLGGTGVAWNVVTFKYTTRLILNRGALGYINQNTWIGGIVRFVDVVGSPSDYHGNTFIGIDISNQTDDSLGDNHGYQVEDDDEDDSGQPNGMIGSYGEDGSDIVGNVHTIFEHKDGNSPSKLGRYNHRFANLSFGTKTRGDYLSHSLHNFCLGGEGDVLDSTGKPPCFDHVGGASVSYTADTDVPGGIGYKYQATFQQNGDKFIVEVPTYGQGFFVVEIDYEQVADVEFEAIVSDYGGGNTESHDTAPADTEMPDGWHRLRLSGQANQSGSTFINLIAANGADIAATVFALGGVVAGTERAVSSPSRPRRRTRYGSATFNPGNLVDAAGETTTVGVTGAALGDFARATFSLDLQGITLSAWVSAADTVSVRFQNESGGAIDLASGTLRVEVQAPFA
jgi:hypothetical protein